MHIYLDHNATTPMLPEVAGAVRDASLRYGANPGSQHEPGRQARRALEAARTRVGELLGARMTGMDADRVIFTSGGTEAANLVIFGLLGGPNTAMAGPRRQLLTSAIEHPCILEAAAQLSNCDVEKTPVSRDGVVDVLQLERSLRPDTQLVSLMLANNETGVLQPVEQVAQLCAQRGVPLHTDAAQAVGKIPVDFTSLGVSALSCAAHKFHGPLGIGALVLKHNLTPRPQMFGGHQQAGIRPGTEMVALAVGLCTALECWHRTADETLDRVRRLRDEFEQSLTHELPYVEVIGRSAPRLPNTSNLAFVGIDRQALLMALDQEDIACSSGSACASGSSEASPVLLAMGLEKPLLEGSLRLSLGSTTTRAEIEEACRRILKICKRLRRE